ncbi:MAG: helix-hairpin-helix domain-containing protein [Nannocystis sp.]|nr:helix-hairpin-helix domain-containing protein [Nannocystis sp.]
MAPDRLAILGAPVNVNEASAAELASLPGIGPVLAARVIEGRPYSKIEDLQRVKGIGRKRFARLRERALVRWSGD